MELSEEKSIVEQSKQDKSKFSKIYESYAQDIYRFSYSLVINQAKAEEITQETFTRALEKIDTFEWRGISIKAWLFAIARNIAYRSFVQKTELPIGDHEDEVADIEHPGGLVDAKLQSDISDALLRLPSVTREIIVLKIWEEYTFREIAGIVDKEEGAVKMQFYRGVAKLRELLERKGYDQTYAIYPVLFAGILAIGKSSLFNLPVGLAVAMGGGMASHTAAATVFGLKPIVAMVAGIVSVAVVGGGGYVAWQYSQQEQDEGDSQEQVEEDVDCIGDGETGMSLSDDPDVCCTGLQKIYNAVPTSDTCAVPSDGSFVCSTCGDDTCGLGENFCNCVADCPAPANPDAQYVWLEFFVPADTGDVTTQEHGVSLKAYVPTGTTVVINADLPIPEVYLDDPVVLDGSRLRFFIPHMALPETFASFVPLDVATLERLYRVYKEDPGYLYTTDLTETGFCVEPVSIAAPCGSPSIAELGVAVYCEGTGADFSFCDGVMRTIERVEED